MRTWNRSIRRALSAWVVAGFVGGCGHARVSPPTSIDDFTGMVSLTQDNGWELWRLNPRRSKEQVLYDVGVGWKCNQPSPDRADCEAEQRNLALAFFGDKLESVASRLAFSDVSTACASYDQILGELVARWGATASREDGVCRGQHDASRATWRHAATQSAFSLSLGPNSPDAAGTFVIEAQAQYAH